jgi:hypothetical protein
MAFARSKLFPDGLPVLFFALLASGVAASGLWIAQGPLFAHLPVARLLVAAGGLFLFFAVSRLRLDLLLWGVLALVGYALGVGLSGGGNHAAALAFFSATLWLALSRRDFHLGEAAVRNAPLLRSFAGFVVLIPLCAFPGLLVDNRLSPEILSFGLMLLGARFCLEIAKRLDPRAENSLLAVYGRGRLVPYFALASFWVLTGAARIGVLGFAVWGVGFAFASFVLALAKPRELAGLAKAASCASLLWHAYAFTAARLLER